jgi:hypothetical protein
MIFTFIQSAGGGASYLLDTYTGASAAWSVRQLKTGVTNCIRIRRSNDNTETDIGFSGGDLDTAAISSFVGSNSAYIVTWYDQSGNSRDYTQSTTSRQPRIVNAGTLDVIGAIAAMKFDGSDDRLTGTGPGASIGMSVFMVGKRRTSGVHGLMFGTDNNSSFAPFLYATYNNDRYGYTVDEGYSNSVSTYATANHEVVTFLYPASVTVQCYVNGSSVALNSNNRLTNTTDFKEIGARSANSEFTDGQFQELIVWDTDQTANRAAIEADIIAYYGI